MEQNEIRTFIDRFKGILAREWISPATVTWIMSELVENNAAHPQYTQNLDWYFMPVINPDGYEYTHTNVSSFTYQIWLFVKHNWINSMYAKSSELTWLDKFKCKFFCFVCRLVFGARPAGPTAAEWVPTWTATSDSTGTVWNGANELMNDDM